MPGARIAIIRSGVMTAARHARDLAPDYGLPGKSSCRWSPRTRPDFVGTIDPTSTIQPQPMDNRADRSNAGCRFWSVLVSCADR